VAACILDTEKWAAAVQRVNIERVNMERVNMERVNIEGVNIEGGRFQRTLKKFVGYGCIDRTLTLWA